LWTGANEHTSLKQALTQSFQVQGFSNYARNSTFSISSSHSLEPADPSENLKFYLGVYVALSVVISLFGTFRYWYIFTGSIRASRRLFERLSFTILRTPLRWMDTVPLGRILNRFTADFNVVDSRLCNDMSFGANNIFRVVGVVVAG
jgi:ABC-type multidrug transport system fused ATPase/permease subunit